MFCFTFHDLLKINLRDRADHPAIVSGDRSLSYAQLNEQVEQLAGNLHELGIRKGDRVGVHLLKSFEEVIASFAISRLGAVFVNIHHQCIAGQLKYNILDCDIRLLITDSRKASALIEAGLPSSIEHILVKGSKALDHKNVISMEDLPSGQKAPYVNIIDTDLCAILYTSGSTGRPKGVMLSHLNVVQSARAAAMHLENNADERAIGIMPMSFDYGLSQLTTMFIVGATLVLQPTATAAEIIKTLVQQRVTGMATVPTIWIPIVRMLEEHPVSLPHLRYVANSGGSLPSSILRAWPKIFPNNTKLYLMYGMTEGFRSSFLHPGDYARKMGSIGKPLPNVELYVVHPEKGLCGPNDHGELLHRGSLISMGYWGKPEATAEKIKPCPHLKHLIGDEKVLYSGDTVFKDADGFLWFVSRTSSFIKCSDFRISPTEVEDILFSSGWVTDVVAFGVPDELLGQVVNAIVSLREGVKPSVGQLLAFCRKHMPSYMWPRAIHLWKGEMLRTANGKIDRPAVISELTERGSKAYSAQVLDAEKNAYSH